MQTIGNRVCRSRCGGPRRSFFAGQRHLWYNHRLTSAKWSRGLTREAAWAALSTEHRPAATIDPKWAVALVEAMPDDPDVKLQHPKNSARLAVAGILGRVGDQRHKKIQSGYVHVWVPDVEDFDTD